MEPEAPRSDDQLQTEGEAPAAALGSDRLEELLAELEGQHGPVDPRIAAEVAAERWLP